jgi:VanZ family protein
MQSISIAFTFRSLGSAMIQLSIAGIRFAVLVLVPYWLLLFIGTHIPTTSMPKIDNLDKVLHASAYAGLAFLLVWAIPKRLYRGPKRYLLAAILAAAYGIFDEASQMLVGRTADVMDWLFDCLGICIGLAVFFFVRQTFCYSKAAACKSKAYSL